MSTPFYGYAEREANSSVNWSQIGSEITDMLQTETKLREDKKAAIDAATREYAETLANSPQGEYTDANEFISNYASEATAAMLVQERLLKSGQLKVKDYVVARDNLKGGTKQMFDIANEYQTKYSEGLKRWKDGESSYREWWQMRQVEGLANFTNSKVLINPTNYQLSIGKMIKGKDGVKTLSKNPNDFMTVNELRNRLQGQFDKFKLKEETVAAVETLGEVTDVIVEAAQAEGGLNKLITNSDSKKGNYYIEGDENIIRNYKTWEDETIGSLIANKNNLQSLLTDFSITSTDGKQIEPTYDYEQFKNDTTGRYFYLDTSTGSAEGIPEFKPEQKTKVENFLRTQIRAQIDVTAKATTSNRPFTPLDRIKYFDDKDKDKNSVLSSLRNYIQMASGAYSKDVANASMYNILNEQVGNVTKEKNNKTYKLYDISPNQQGKRGFTYTWVNPSDIKDKFVTENVFSDKKTYILGVKSLLPNELKEVLTDDELYKEGIKIFNDNKKDIGFNDYKLRASVGTGDRIAQLQYVIMEDGKPVGQKPIATKYEGKTDGKQIVNVSNEQIMKYNANALPADQADLTTEFTNDILFTKGNQSTIGIKNLKNPASTKAHQKITEFILKIKNKEITTEDQAKAEADDIVDTLRKRLYDLGNMDETIIVIGGKEYAPTTLNVKKDVFDSLMNLAGNPTWGTGTGTGTTNNSRSKYNK